jgi:FMN phosphatase YigB (HAD superfamily)
MMPPAVVLWDFGDTLVDERWMLRAPELYPAWPTVWVEVMSAYAEDWDAGRVNEGDIVAALAARTGMRLDEVEQHVANCCRSVLCNPVAWRVAAERRLPQALVTVNPDLFVNRVMPAYGLDAVFDAIAVSCMEGTTDKVRLCEIALRRLGFDGDRRDVLLIDNRRDLVDAWRNTGGIGYWYRDDTAFDADLPGLFGRPSR